MKLILLDRGDRPTLTAWIKDRFSNYDIIHPNFPPIAGVKDITLRLREGIAMASREDFVYVIENDDYYPKDYIERMEAYRKLHNADWVGDFNPYYYSISSSTWQQFNMRASGLWCMGFKPSIMDHIQWKPDSSISMDSLISKEVTMNMNIRAIQFSDHHAIGIKGHGIGLNGSSSHLGEFTNLDPGNHWLRNVTDESFMELHGLD